MTTAEPVRLAITGIFHETNTYATDCTGLTTIDRFEILRGEQIVERHRGTRTQVGGILAAAEELRATVVPLLQAMAMPSGTVDAAAYQTLKSEILDRLAGAGRLDALVLVVHGAGVIEGIDDLEADLSAAVRVVVGEAVKIVAALDLHANVTAETTKHFDLMLGVHNYPHTDMFERGQEVVRLLPRLLTGELRPVTHVERLPILLPASTTEPGAPAAEMNELCQSLERRPGVIDCTVFHGFPYADVPRVGMSVLCIADGDAELARMTAAEAATWVWANRERFRPETHLPSAAVRLALEVGRVPVVINDTGDNSGGGAPGDGTHLLRAFLDAELDRAVFGSICDPAVAEAAHQAGVGATIDVTLGGKHGSLHGEPVELRAYVKCLTDGKFQLTSPMGAGYAIDMGRCARLVTGGLDVIVASQNTQTLDEQIFLLHGIDVRTRSIVGLKSSQHFRGGFGPLAAAIITADTPGLTAQRTELFEHRRPGRPLWPIDPAAEYRPPSR